MAKPKGGKGGASGSKKSKGASSTSNSNNNTKKSRQKKFNHKSNSSNSLTAIDDTSFRTTLLNQGYTITEISSDGNCLFRSLSDQLHNDHGSHHDTVRHEICNHLSQNKEEFYMFLLMEDGDEDVMDFEEYVDKMRGDGEWGGNVELVAASRVYGRGVKIFSGVFDGGVMSIEGGGGGGSDNDGSEEKKNWKNNYNGEKEDGGDLLLSYHENDHYNSVRAINASYPNQSAKEKSDLLSSLNGTAINNTSLKKGKQTQNSNNNTNSNTKGGGRKTMELEVTSQSPGRKKQLTRGADCPCGSGLKYKKCCLSKYKSKTRLDNKTKGKNGVVNDDDNKSGAATAAKANGDDLTTTADNEYIGNFKVLTI